jgi:RNA polymerase sigma factor for flagellar operon FliA
MEQTSTDTLWQEYFRTKSKEAKRQLVMKYLGIVKFVVSKFRGYSKHAVTVIDEQDLTQLGLIGLLDAIDRFDPKRGVKFETYAITRIRGTVQDELRKLDWVPRSVREKVRTVDRMTQWVECAEETGGFAKTIEAEFGMSVEEYVRLVHDAQAYVPEAAAKGEKGEDLIEHIADEDASNPAEQLGNEQVKDMVIEIVENLPKQDRLIVSLYYYEELTFKEIAGILRLSESRVFQKHAAILERLREQVAELV